MKRIKIIRRIQVCLIQQMKLETKKNGGKKALATKPKHQYRVSQYREHDCHANNKRNKLCYRHPSLSHFMDELRL